MNEEKKALKQKYIPLFAQGKISERDCARLIGIQPVSAWRLKERFLKEGYACFEHKNKGRKPKNKLYSPEEEKFIVDLYLSEFENTEFRKFTRILRKDYNILYSYSSVALLLKKHNIESPLTIKYKGNKKESEYFVFFRELKNALGYDGKSDLPYIEFAINSEKVESSKMYGVFFLCDCLYNSAFLELKKIIFNTENINLNTAHSVFKYCIEKQYLDINDEWNYWNENHKYFFMTYDEKIRNETIFDVHEIYFQMFYKVYEFLSQKKIHNIVSK